MGIVYGQSITIAGAPDAICDRIVKRSPTVYSDGRFIFEAYISCEPTVVAARVCVFTVSMGSSSCETFAEALAKGDYIDFVNAQELAGITITQDRPGECVLSLWVDDARMRWERRGWVVARTAGHRFIARFWDELMRDLQATPERKRGAPPARRRQDRDAMNVDTAAKLDKLRKLHADKPKLTRVKACNEIGIDAKTVQKHAKELWELWEK